MSLDFSKLVGDASAKQTDPRKIFSTLQRDARFKRPLDEQADVLDAWYARRASKDLTIKMNTGGGKTVVGLLCLQSSLNENVKPAVYITPDPFLTKQVLQEAKALGIPATDREQDPEFVAGRAILVANVHKLFNGKSVFGVGESKIPLGALVVDDAHACLSVVSEQFAIHVDADSEIYDGLLNFFEQDLAAQSSSGLLDLKAHETTIVMPVPYWAWHSRQTDVMGLLHAHRNSDELKFNWPLLKECIEFCTCVFGGTRLEIYPRFLPIDVIPSFAHAKRRIYMTATLADDTILVSHFQASAEDVAKPIRPKGGGDIGDRMILAPQEITPSITVEEVRALAAEIASTRNVVVIVPSHQRAEFWKGVAAQILDKNSIAQGVERLHKGHVGLTVFVNKYDGIDLPGKACELLVIDGLPEVYGLGDRMEMLAIDGTKRQLVRQIQRVEQGMGRGVRSSDDHCAVLLLGPKLTQRLHQPDADGLFSAATSAQIALGRSVAKQVSGKPVHELRPILDLCLSRDPQWVSAGRNVVVNAQPVADSHIDVNQVQLRKAFDLARVKRYTEAASLAQQAVYGASDAREKGYLKQQLAEYIDFYDPASSQELQLSALSDNPRLLKPLAGATFRKLSAPAGGQSQAAANFMRERFIEGNDLIIWVNGLLEDLNWGESGVPRFEAGMCDLGAFLGFGSQRPEEDMGRGPDNLWALGDLQYFVIECKSGATKAQRISKSDTNQLNGSIVWFKSEYDATCSATPILVHLKTEFENAASPDPAIRIMNSEGLERLRAAVKAYAIALASSGTFRDAREVEKQLAHHSLLASALAKLCTVKQSPR